jgi:hypothetical protein
MHNLPLLRYSTECLLYYIHRNSNAFFTDAKNGKSNLTSLTAKRDTQGTETLLHSELKISFYRKGLILRMG